MGFIFFNGDVFLASRYMNSQANGNEAYEPTEIEHVANVVTHGVRMPSLSKFSCFPYLGMCCLAYAFSRSLLLFFKSKPLGYLVQDSFSRILNCEIIIHSGCSRLQSNLGENRL